MRCQSYRRPRAAAVRAVTSDPRVGIARSAFNANKVIVVAEVLSVIVALATVYVVVSSAHNDTDIVAIVVSLV